MVTVLVASNSRTRRESYCSQAGSIIVALDDPMTASESWDTLSMTKPWHTVERVVEDRGMADVHDDRPRSPHAVKPDRFADHHALRMCPPDDLWIGRGRLWPGSRLASRRKASHLARDIQPNAPDVPRPSSPRAS